MKMQKIFMVVVLVIFVGLIIFALVQVNSKSEEKISKTQQNTQAINTVASTAVNSGNATNSNNSGINVGNTINSNNETKNNNSGTIRKSNQKVEADMNNITEITDNFFIEQTNDVYYNLKEYLGKTIKIEGFVSTYQDSNKDICYCVIRNTPGCCGNDGLAGLDIRYDGEYPEEKTWVEVIGVVGKDTAFGDEIPAIQVTSITPKAEGKTFVTN